MCAKVREQMPVEENGRPTPSTRRRPEIGKDYSRDGVWRQIVGLNQVRAWILR